MCNVTGALEFSKSGLSISPGVLFSMTMLVSRILLLMDSFSGQCGGGREYKHMVSM